MAAVIIRIALPEDSKCPSVDNGLRDACSASSVRTSNLGFWIVERLENAGMDHIVREPLELRLDPEVEPEPREEPEPFHGLRVVEGGGEPSLAVGEKGGEGLGEKCAGRALDDRTAVRGG